MRLGMGCGRRSWREDLWLDDLKRDPGNIYDIGHDGGLKCGCVAGVQGLGLIHIPEG